MQAPEQKEVQPNVALDTSNDTTPKPSDKAFAFLDEQIAQDTVDSLATNEDGMVNKANELRVNDPEAYEAFIKALKKAEGSLHITKALEKMEAINQAIRDKIVGELLDAKQNNDSASLNKLAEDIKSEDMSDVDKLIAKETLRSLATSSSNRDVAKLAQFVLDRISR